MNPHCQIAPNAVAETAAPGANQPLQTRLAFFVARQHTASRRRGAPRWKRFPLASIASRRHLITTSRKTT
ncbi:hypothetical protein BVI434_360074 [Burkholderia vietnamiensis]|nr:hypothetical protein BVI434_360074 [Burkholderia vietnamiensis]